MIPIEKKLMLRKYIIRKLILRCIILRLHGLSTTLVILIHHFSKSKKVNSTTFDSVSDTQLPISSIVLTFQLNINERSVFNVL